MDHDPPMDWSPDDDTAGFDDALADEPGTDLPGFDHDEATGFDEPADTDDPGDEPAGDDDLGYDDPGQPADGADPLPPDPSSSDSDEAVDDDGPDLPEPVSGAQPDLDLLADDPGWADEDPFPPALDVGEPPEPVDGFPWSDPAVLGEQQDTGQVAAPTPDPAGLAAYDRQDPADGADPWQALAGSDDPATSSLARWWAPS